MFSNVRGYPLHKGLGQNDVALGIDVIFLVETKKHETKHILYIDGYIIKLIWPRFKRNIRCVGISCIHHKSLDKK